jgi:hypothetical protein
MNEQTSTWALGLAGSVAAHAGLYALLLIAINPEPVAKQPTPNSELEVQAYALERTDAHEQQPESQRTDTNTPDGAALDAGAIPQSQVKSAPAVAVRLRPNTAPIPITSEVRQPAVKLTTSYQPPPRIKASQSAPTELSHMAIPAVSALPAVMRTESNLPLVQLAVATAKTTIPAAAPVQQADVKADTLLAAISEPNSAISRPATPSAQKLRATLAFSGADGDVDPVSVAAFQSFMRPGDIAASSDQLRDGVSGLLAQVPCSRMQVAFDPETATLQVNGHIPDDDLRAPVLAALRVQMGANITVSDNMLILPRPQCGALSGIARVGLPQSTDQITNPLVIGKDAQARVFDFVEGDLWGLQMTAPDYDAYIYLDYFDAAGNVLHVEPNEQVPLRHALAQNVQTIGADSDQGEGLKLVIGPPYGQEIAVAFAASEPLYEGLRPIQEPAAEYLEWLQIQVEKARADHADFKGEWVYFFVSTKSR